MAEPRRYARGRFLGVPPWLSRLLGFPALNIGAQGLEVSGVELRAAFARAAEARPGRS